MTALMRMMMRALAVYLPFVAFTEEDEKTSFEEAIFMSDLIPSNFMCFGVFNLLMEPSPAICFIKLKYEDTPLKNSHYH